MKGYLKNETISCCRNQYQIQTTVNFFTLILNPLYPVRLKNFFSEICTQKSFSSWAILQLFT